MLKNLIVALTGLLALAYLVNPTAGVFELIPDNLPIVGNLDEAAATALIIAVLRYFGLDITRLFSKDKKPPAVDLNSDEYKSRDSSRK
jgi:uncharacterized membrane protein YkvA (DUF1232 family)